MSAAAAASSPCLGKCWSSGATTSITTLEAYFTKYSIWNCSACAKLQPGGCSYGSVFDGTGCLQCVHDAENAVMAPTQPDNCSAALMMCAKGYYPFDSYATTVDCTPCGITDIIGCPNGHYPSKCLGQCIPCTTPPLPLGYQYGKGIAYKDCATTPNPSPSICAWFQTPQWGGGYCQLICADGFATLPSGACKKCKTQAECGAGWLAPVCSNTTECVPCSAPPNGTRWSGYACNLTCIETEGVFYSSQQNACMPCTRCNQGSYPAGCGASYGGTCQPCDITKCGQNQYTSARNCACKQCTTYFDVARPSFIVSDCTKSADTVFAPCSQACPPNTFQASECYPRGDITCQPCSRPPAGVFIASACSPTSDAVFTQCPPTKACLDGAVVECNAKMTAVDGECRCAQGYSNLSNHCEPMVCPPKMFANPDTGRCASCGIDANIITTASPATIGLRATCGCAPGYFRRFDGGTLACWPCGDLVCDPATQRQLPACDKFDDEDEPSCVCGRPPATAAAAGCAFRCADGYDEAATIQTGDYVERVGFTLQTRLKTYYSSVEPTNRAVALGAQDALVLLSDGTTLQSMRTGERYNLSALLFIQDYRYEFYVTDIEPAWANFFWIAFTFSGQCGPSLLTPDTVVYHSICSAVELVSFSAEAGITIPMIWGKLFPWLGVVGRITSLAYDAGDRVLYMAIGNLKIKTYKVVFYGSSMDQRTDDPLVDYAWGDEVQDLTVCGGRLHDALAIVANAETIFCPRYSSGNTNIMFVTTRDGTWMQVDTANKIVGTPSPFSRFFAVSADGAFAHVTSDASAATELTVWAVTPCPSDYYYYHGASACVPLPCLLACGPNRTRYNGACRCSPGYYAGACYPCLKNHICPDGESMIRCATVTEVARDNKCVCAPGYFKYGPAACLPCPSNHWCFDGNVIPCNGETLGMAMTSPLDCICPPRTYGVQCLPCRDDSDCSTPLPQPPARDVWIISNTTCRKHVDILVLTADVVAIVATSAEVMAACGPETRRLHPSRPPTRERRMVKCGHNAEWFDGQCICKAGHGLSCLPCLNGSFRARHDKWPLCTACDTAPYLGMDACLPGVVITPMIDTASTLAMAMTCILLTFAGACLGIVTPRPLW